MTTMDNAPSLGQFAAMKIASYLANRSNAKAKNHTRTWVQTTIRLVLHLAGFACLTYGAFTWDPVAGFVTAGLSCFLLSWLTTNGQPDVNETIPVDPILMHRR